MTSSHRQKANTSNHPVATRLSQGRGESLFLANIEVGGKCLPADRVYLAMPTFTRNHPLLLIIALIGTRPVCAADSVDFVRDIQPILREACVQCHGAEKQKGKLRLDTREALFKGGEDAKSVEPGSPEKSDIFRRIVLPEDDDDVMPPKGKVAHLTPAQIEKVKRWIAAGAKWPEGVVVESGPTTAPHKTVGKSVRAASMETVGPVASPAELQAIAALGKFGIKPRPIAAGVNWRRANFRVAGDSFPPETFALLRQVTTLTELNLGGVRLTDEDLANIAGLKNLEVLHLDSTPITDAGLAHVGTLESLISLNLFGTAITDAGLQHLAGLRHLHSLYLAETKVTAQGVARLQNDLPNVQIDTGVELKDLARKEPPAPAKPPVNKETEREKKADAGKPAEPVKQPPTPKADVEKS
ncbi:MAG: c-type cytochrome domain-containing protein [Chthoniobacteraceae bacterium]